MGAAAASAAGEVDDRVRRLEPADAAWIAALPCALLTYVGIRALGRPLGEAFLAPGPEVFWSSVRRLPEPTEHAQYAIAVLALPLLAAAVLASTRWQVAMRPGMTRALRTIAQIALVAFVVFCFVRQQETIWWEAVSRNRFFTPPTLIFAAVLTLVTTLVLRSPRAKQAVARVSRETPMLRAICLATAVLATAVWLMTAINTDGSIGNAMANHLIPWDTNEAYAVLNGRTPLVNFHAQYGQLWPYAAAAIMALFGSSLGLLTIAMATVSCLALLGVYAVFRRIVHSSLLALVVYLPFMATSFFITIKPLENRFSPASTLSLWPLRYGGAYLMAWLTVRHIDRVAPRRSVTLFLFAGLVAINNLEFGVAAFAATLAAVACGTAPRSAREVGRLLLNALAGLLGAFLLVSLLTLIHAGQLPRFSLLLEFPRLYARGGWVLVRMVPFGLHIVVYLTFVSAGVLAVVRAIRGEEPLLTSMLAWSAVFGLLAGGYFVGRSDALNMIALFSAWSFALSMLSIAVVQALSWRRPSLPEIAVLFGFGLTVCSLVQVPTPWSQIARLREHTEVPAYKRPDVERFVARETQPGAEVALLLPMGHRIAHDLGRTNIVPYSSVESIATLQQVRTTTRLLRSHNVHRLFLGIRDLTPGNILPDVLAAFQAEGFALRAQMSDIFELSDAPEDFADGG